MFIQTQIFNFPFTSMPHSWPTWMYNPFILSFIPSSIRVKCLPSLIRALSLIFLDRQQCIHHNTISMNRYIDGIIYYLRDPEVPFMYIMWKSLILNRTAPAFSHLDSAAITRYQNTLYNTLCTLAEEKQGVCWPLPSQKSKIDSCLYDQWLSIEFSIHLYKWQVHSASKVFAISAMPMN